MKQCVGKWWGAGQPHDAGRVPEAAEGWEAFDKAFQQLSLRTPALQTSRACCPPDLLPLQVMGIAGVDTRAITRRLRVTGCLNGAITTDPNISGEGRCVRCTALWFVAGQVDLPAELCGAHAVQPGRCRGAAHVRSRLLLPPLPAVLCRRGAAAALQVVDDCGQGPDQGGAALLLGCLGLNSDSL